MARLLILTFLHILTFTTQAQIVGYRVDKYVSEKAIDTFLIYSLSCSGGSIRFDSYKNDDPHYLIWKKEGNYFLKKFDYCNNFKIIILDSANPLIFYLVHKKVINKEQIKPPTYYEIKKKNKPRLVVTSMVSHSCFHKFALPFKEKQQFKYADTYNLDFIKFDNGKKNIYYNYNQKTKFKALIDLITGLIMQLDLNKKLEPE